MINQHSIETVDASTFSERFRAPNYDAYCFANIPGTIEAMLCGTTTRPQLPADVLPTTMSQPRHVVLFFIDAFGWRFFERYREQFQTLRRFCEHGVASKTTSQFPSTTAAHVTTINTGLPVYESGVFEWYYYEPTLDTVIAPLLFSFAGKDQDRGTLTAAHVDPKTLYPNETLYQQLAGHGVTSYLYQSAAFTPSPYGDVVTAGVDHVHPYQQFSEVPAALTKALQSPTQPSYHYVYCGDIDGVGHLEGPDSHAFDKAAAACFETIEQFFIQYAGRGDTLIMLTADHGQVTIDPTKTIYLNQRLPEIATWVERTAAGEPIRYAGSSRDCFLYLKPACVEVAQRTLAELLRGQAEVYKTSELIAAGLFGPHQHERLLARLGNICILPYAGESVLWYEPGRFEETFHGHHGGLTPEEMETVLLTLQL